MTGGSRSRGCGPLQPPKSIREADGRSAGFSVVTPRAALSTKDSVAEEPHSYPLRWPFDPPGSIRYIVWAIPPIASVSSCSSLRLRSTAKVGITATTSRNIPCSK
jgi:hypothetical protein